MLIKLMHSLSAVLSVNDCMLDFIDFIDSVKIFDLDEE